MSNRIRIVKQYKSTSPKAGIEEADTLTIEGGAEGAALFVTRVNMNDRLDYTIIDYEVALVSKMERPEIITNKSGGATGKLLVPGKDF